MDNSKFLKLKQYKKEINTQISEDVAAIHAIIKSQGIENLDNLSDADREKMLTHQKAIVNTFTTMEQRYFRDAPSTDSPVNPASSPDQI